MAQGEFFAFITQNVVTKDETWLYNIVTALEHFPKAAGAFGRHTASPTSSPFVRRDIRAHFESLGRYPLALSRNTDADRWRSGEKEWRQILHYFSDNNSCLRRSIWKRVPYPEVDYGEDQIWANTIIERGFEKVYVPFANVYHSHDYTPEETYARASTEALFFATTFGYKSYDVSRGFDEQLAYMDHADSLARHAKLISQLELTHQLTLNEATLKGRLQGLKQAVANCQKT
jgi:hypothetical protein